MQAFLFVVLAIIASACAFAPHRAIKAPLRSVVSSIFLKYRNKYILIFLI